MVAEKLLKSHLLGHPNKPRVLLSAFTGKAASLIGMNVLFLLHFAVIILNIYLITL